MNDATRRGSRNYDWFDRERYKEFFLREHVGADRAIGEKDVHRALGIEGRTQRAIRADLEVDEELGFGGGDDGAYVAEYLEDIERKNARDRAQAASLERCAAARDRWARREQLPRRQNFLF